MSEEKDLSDAYVFAFPLVIMDATMKHMTNVEEPVNTAAPMGVLGHSFVLADANSRFVVTPNVDTLYSVCYLDLAKCPYILDVPVADRYVSYELLDGYTNCVAVFGSGMAKASGRYLIAGPDFKGGVPEGCELVEIPTNLMWMIVRTICTDPNDKAEMKEIDSIRSKISISPVDGNRQPKGHFDPKYDCTPVSHVIGMDADMFFNKFNKLSVCNPPSKDDAAFLDRIAYLGIGPGLDFDKGKLSEEGQAVCSDIGKRFAKEVVGCKATYQHEVNGWMYWDNRMAEFGTEYVFRALVALAGLGANPVKMAIYPFCESDSEGQPFNGKNSYLMHLDSVPPVTEWGFWSFTLYGDDNFLVANQIDKYCINDRSELIYNQDGSLDIHISEIDKGYDNWLPCGNAGFHLVLRVYLPAEEMLSEKWVPPKIKKV